MFKIKRIEIDGFWLRHDVSCDFNLDTNIIIGRNGSGKTTFMNILQSVLTVDIKNLIENDFQVAKIYLVDGARSRIISAKKTDESKYNVPAVEYLISNNKYEVPLLSDIERKVTSYARHRSHKQAYQIVKQELEKLIIISSLSVYRLRHEDEFEVRRSRDERSLISPVDYRLDKAIERLADYQLALLNKSRDVSKKLSRDVLASLLYEDIDSSSRVSQFFDTTDPIEEEEKLVNAYTQLNSIDEDIEKKIKFHVESVTKTKAEVETYFELDDESRSKTDPPLFAPMSAHENIQSVIKLSLEAEERNKKIYSRLDLFKKTVESFIEEKKFNFEAGRLQVQNEGGHIEHLRLSSGEKQLLILLIEALLQNQEPHVFLTDEPELSLHISWQRTIIPAVRELNPSAQIIVATHSPEVASSAKSDQAIIKMDTLFDE